MLTRAEFLRKAVAGSAGAYLAARGAVRLFASQGPGADGMDARAADVVRAYDAQGIHRTATDVDNRSGVWLRDLAAAAGGQAATETFRLGRVDIHDAFVQCSDRRLEALPLFDGSFTD